MKGRHYKYDTTNIQGDGQVPGLDCNSISFYNPTGNTTVLYVNNAPVNPGCIYTLPGLAGETDKSLYDIRMTVPTDKCFVTRKTYEEEDCK